MNNIDRHILHLLQRDASISLKELADTVGLSTTPCWKRVKRLEEEGYVAGRVTLLNPEKLGLGLSVFVQIKTQRHDRAWLEEFAETVSEFEEVVEFYRMAGEWDYMLRVVVSDIAAYDHVYKRLIANTEGLTNVSAGFAMEQIKYTTALPLPR